jgi:membrane-bound metal-dependent hydrolase YbcI (DUF457 family)
MERRVMAALTAGSLAPDLDLLLLPFGIFNAVHRTATHSLSFVILFAVICMLFTRRRRGLVLAFAALGGLLHLLVDSMMDANPSNGIGVALFWPATDASFSPFNVALTSCPGWGDLGAASLCNLLMLVWEIPAYVATVWIVWRCHGMGLRRLRTNTPQEQAPPS